VKAEKRDMAQELDGVVHEWKAGDPVPIELLKEAADEIRKLRTILWVAKSGIFWLRERLSSIHSQMYDALYGEKEDE
jgi:N-acetylglucosamine kinase-like BadF-type ATPase